jgi:hypothetical protein
MKTHSLKTALLSVIVLGGFSLSAKAGQDSRDWKIFTDAEYLGIGNANALLSHTPNCDQWATLGGSQCSISTKASGAEGFRAGFFQDFRGADIGVSIGYLDGGPDNGTTTLKLANPNQVGIASRASTIRLLGEVRKTWNLTEALGLRLGTGVGIAAEHRTITNTCINITCPQFATPDDSNLGWITWEFSPALVYRKFSLGLRYVGFARGSAIPWNTLGGFLGVDF